MNKRASLGVLVNGIRLVIFRIKASVSFASDVSRFVTGLPADRAMIWPLIGDIVMPAGGANPGVREPE